MAQLLNEAQRGTASAHLRYAKMLWELATADAATTRDQLLTAMKWFATVAEVRTEAAAVTAVATSLAALCSGALRCLDTVLSKGAQTMLSS